MGEIHDKLIKYRGTDISLTYIVSRCSDTQYFGDISPKYHDIFLLGCNHAEKIKSIMLYTFCVL